MIIVILTIFDVSFIQQDQYIQSKCWWPELTFFSQASKRQKEKKNRKEKKIASSISCVVVTPISNRAATAI